MIADYKFYTDVYHGILIKSEQDYAYFAERASDELAPFSKKVPQSDEAQTDLKKCACAVTDIMFGEWAQSKNGGSGKIASESIGGYYSVSYSLPTSAEINAKINKAITNYIGRYVLGARSVVM